MSAGPTVSFVPDGQPVALELLRGISRHRVLFLSAALLVGGLGAGAVELLPTRYAVTATVVVTPLLPDPMGAGGRDDSPLRDDEVATQAALMTSRDLAVEIAGQFPVGAAPSLLSGARQRLCALAGPLLAGWASCREAAAPPPEARAASFLAGLRAVPTPRTRLIELTYSDADPAVAASALNALIELYQREQIAQRAADLSRTSTWIADRVETLRQSWLAAEARAGQFRTRNSLTPTGAREASAPLATQQVASAATSLSSAQAELAAARARQAALRAAGSAPDRLAFVTMRDEPGLVQLGTQVSQLRAQLADMRAQYSDTYPGLAMLRSQLAAQERQLAVDSARALHAVEVELQVKQSLVANLEQTLAALRTQAGDLNEQQVQLSTLEDQARSARTVFETFLGRARQLDDRGGLLQSQVQFATHATATDSPAFPNRPRLWLGVAALALAVAFGLVLLRDALSRGFSNISRVGAQLALPFLCAIPAVPHGLLRRTRRRLAEHVHDHPFSSAAEAMRTLLTQFQLPNLRDGAVRTVVIASATGEEGKTTTSIWLASIAARSGSRVLLVDGDHRRGSVNQRLRGSGTSGFSDVVFGGTDILSVVQHDATQGFDFVAAGPPVSRSFARADVERLERTLRQLETLYDLVIIDTPPLLSMTDAVLYARLASGVVFLCRWSRTSRAAVSGCLARLRAAHANVLGVALSMVDENRLAQFSDELTRYDVRAMKRYYIG